MKFYSKRKGARRGRRSSGPMKSSVVKVSRGGIRL